jgi:hypothetical protein
VYEAYDKEFFMSIGTTSLCHIAILVRDITAAVDNWSVLLGLDKPKIWTFPPPGTVKAFTRGTEGDYSDCRLAVFELANVRLELVEPGPGSGPWTGLLHLLCEGVLERHPYSEKGVWT